MGIPIESRLSAEALRKRQLLIFSWSSHSSSSADDVIPVARRRTGYRTDVSPNPLFGLDRSSVEAMVTYYEAYARRRPNHSCKGRLVLVRKILPHPVRVRRSAVARLGSHIARLRMVSRSRDFLELDRLMRQEVRLAASDNAESSADSPLSDDEHQDHTIGSPVDENLTHFPGGDADLDEDRLPSTSVGVSIFYTEDGDPEAARVWELGCWAGAHQLAGVDMFQVFLDVLTEATSIPACSIDSLFIKDDLEVCRAVSEGIDLLKDLSAELHTSYDTGSNYFLHPITGSRIEIVVDR